MVRIAAAADVHASEASAERLETAFADLSGKADVVLLAGDLTTRGEPEQAEVLADGGVRVLDREFATCCIDELELGIVGTKGFVGGFPGSALPDFGEPLLRRVYAETTAEAEAIASGL